MKQIHNFTLRLSTELKEKLHQLAKIERRKPGDMLRILLIDELERRGMLEKEKAE